MRIFIMMMAVLITTSCGKTNNNNEKSERSTNPLCAVNTESEGCKNLTQYIIVSKKSLPRKMKVYFKNSSQKLQVLNQCNPQESYVLFPITGVSMIGFRRVSDLFKEGMNLEIVDAGEDCQNDAIFFDEPITPEDSHSWEGTKVTKTFSLGN